MTGKPIATIVAFSGDNSPGGLADQNGSAGNDFVSAHSSKAECLWMEMSLRIVLLASVLCALGVGA